LAGVTQNNPKNRATFVLITKSPWNQPKQEQMILGDALGINEHQMINLSH
jgi:hypothetical protein